MLNIFLEQNDKDDVVPRFPTCECCAMSDKYIAKRVHPCICSFDDVPFPIEFVYQQFVSVISTVSFVEAYIGEHSMGEALISEYLAVKAGICIQDSPSTGMPASSKVPNISSVDLLIRYKSLCSPDTGTDMAKGSPCLSVRYKALVVFDFFRP